MPTILEKVALIQIYIHLAKGVEVQVDPSKILGNPRQIMLLEHAFGIAQAHLSTINTYFH